jgi:hypothetical protein
MSTKICNRIQVEKYFLGEIQGEERSALRLHLDTCAECQSQMANLESEKRNYLIAHPFREFAARRLPADASRGKRSLPRWLPALAGVAACLFVLPLIEKRMELARNPVGMETGPAINSEGIRTKGGAIFEFYCKRGGLVQAGLVSEVYQAGDELQFVYGGDGHSFVTLTSIDTNGLVSLYRPEGESLKVSLPVLPGPRQTLPFAVTLDAAPGSELFILIYSSSPLNGQGLETWLRGGFTRVSGNLDSLHISLFPPPIPKSRVMSLLLRKAKA